MATMTVSLPDPMKDWVEKLVEQGGYASTSDYVRDAIRRDRERREPEYQMTLDELKQMFEDSRRSGISTRTTSEVFEDARRYVARKRAALE
jgi:antitoxin ParD1/3/4